MLIDKINFKKYEFGVACTEEARKEYAELLRNALIILNYIVLYYIQLEIIKF